MTTSPAEPTAPTGAYLEEHSYDSFPKPVPFWIVRCDHPSHGPILLNSGHHYREEVKPYAEALVTQHDADEHQEGQEAVSEPLDPKPFTHITVTFREILEGTQPVEGEATIELTDAAWQEDVIDWSVSDAPKENVDDPESSDVTIHRDDMDDLFEAMENALIAAGRKTSFNWYETGDIFVLAYLDTDGEIQVQHTYVADGLSYLEDVDWVTSWRFHYGE